MDIKTEIDVKPDKVDLGIVKEEYSVIENDEDTPEYPTCLLEIETK